ncbi:SDR family NAD(P)-dependent oxidoreductase [Lentisphaerota bacterium WC36G]|nr:SDR family NAD(P)-dependent oxidoreductase [Lentisphaerae bacterium WC36]
MGKKVAVITGASSGLGAALANKFYDNNFTVVALCRSEPNHEEINYDLWIKTDITKADNRENAAKIVTEKFGRCDVLINNAGLGEYATWLETSEDELKQLFELNYFAVIEVTKVFYSLIEKTQGTIINTSSIAGKLHVTCMGNYCASKYALNAFSDSLRAEVEQKGVKVLNIITGRVNTGFSSRALAKRSVPSSPGGSSTNPADFANCVFKAYLKRKREIYYPAWYRIAPLVPKLFPKYYNRKNRQKWQLD